MKKILIVMMVLLSILIVAGCNDKQAINMADYENYTKVGELTDGSYVLFKDNHSILIVNGKDNLLSTNEYVSIPDISPNKEKVVYIDPFLWEEIGDLYIYDANKKKSEVAIEGLKLNNQMTIKSATWLNDDYILTIIGYAYGTVNIGGDLYVYDTKNKKLSLAIKAEDLKEITNVTVHQDQVTLEIAKWKDYLMTSYTTEKKTMNASEILSKAGIQ